MHFIAKPPQTLREDHHCGPSSHMALVVKGGWYLLKESQHIILAHALDTCKASSEDGEHLEPNKSFLKRIHNMFDVYECNIM